MAPYIYTKGVKMRGSRLYILLGLIILSSVFLRLIPALRYPYPITDDSLKDYQQARYIIENKEINPKSYHGFATFPIFHILIAFLNYTTTIDALTLFRFIPSIFAGVGVLFFFLFVRDLTKDDRTSLIAASIYGSWFASVWWEAISVRESLALPVFSIILYLCQKYLNSKNNGWLSLFIIFLVSLIPMHHWTSLMMFITLIIFLIYYNFDRGLIKVIILFATLMLIYWYTKFPYIISLTARAAFALLNINFTLFAEPPPALPSELERPVAMLQVSAIDYLLLIATILMCVFFLAIVLKGNRFKKSFKLKNLENITFLTNLLSLFIIILFFIYSKSWTVFEYPIQIFINPFLIGFFALPGFVMLIYEKKLKFIGFLGLWLSILITGFTLHKFTSNFDVNRITEFLIYPLAILVANRLKYFRNGFLFPLIIVLFLSSTFAYPDVFVYGKPLPIDSPFSDIRSYLRFVPPEGIAAMEWAKSKNISLESDNRYIQTFYETFYLQNGTKWYLHVSDYDLLVEKRLERINEPILGSLLNSSKRLAEKNYTLIFYNGWSYIYKADD